METCIGCIPDERRNKKSHDFEKIFKRLFLRKRALFEPYLERKAGHFIDTIHKKIIPIPQGKVILGSSSGLLYKDFHIEGREVEESHCYLFREGYSVTLYPVATSTFVDGHRVIKPVKLEDSALLRLGKSNVFRVRLPQESHVNQWNTPGYLSRKELQQQIRLHYGRDLISGPLHHHHRSSTDPEQQRHDKLRCVSSSLQEDEEHFAPLRSAEESALKTAKFDDLKRFLLEQATKRLSLSKDCNQHHLVHHTSAKTSSGRSSSPTTERESSEREPTNEVDSAGGVDGAPPSLEESRGPLPRTSSDSLLHSRSHRLQALFAGDVVVGFEKAARKGSFGEISKGRRCTSNYELSCVNDNSCLHFLSPCFAFDRKTFKERVISMDRQDLENLSVSHLDLKNLYQRQRAERLREQQRAVEEQRRLEELLRMCHSFDVGRVPPPLPPSQQQQQHQQQQQQNGATSESAKEGSEGGGAKGDRTADRSDLTSADADSDDRVSPAVDSGVEFCSPDWSQVPQKPFARGARPSGPAGHRSASEDRKYFAPAAADRECPPDHLFASRFATPLNTMRFGSESKLWEDSGYEVQILYDLRRDVVQNVAEMKNKLAEVESHHNEVLREFDVERALMEGEQEILLGRHDEVRSRLADVEARMADLLEGVRVGKDKDLIKAERSKLKGLEAKRKALEAKASGAAEASEVETELEEAKEAEESQRSLLENLEFQMLEGESKLEDEREKNLLQLAEEKDALMKSCKSFKDAMDHLSGQKFEMIRQIESDLLEIEHMKHDISRQLEKEEVMLARINQQIENLKFIPSSRSYRIRKQSLLPRRRLESTTKSSRSLASTTAAAATERLRHASRTLPRLNTMSGHLAANSFDGYDGSTAGGLRGPPLLPECLSSGAVLIRKASSWLAIPSDTDDSSVGESGNNSDRATSREDPMEKIKDMECQLILARAEKMRLLEKQKFLKEKEESLEEEQRRRRRRRLEEEERKTNHESSDGNRTARATFEGGRGRRPAGGAFDLIGYISSCGHSPEQCRHVLLTASSCRGLLTKMTGGLRGHLRLWRKRWFLFDGRKRCLSYYSDKREEKPRGVIYFQSIEDVFVDHLHQVNSPTPQLTFCVKTCERAYYLVAPALDALRIWIDVILTGAEAYQQTF